MNGSLNATKTSDKVAIARNVVSMPTGKAPSKVATLVLGARLMRS